MCKVALESTTYKVPFLKVRLQTAAPKLLHWSREKRALIGMEVKKILEKGAIAQVCH